MIKTDKNTNHGLTQMDTDKKKLPEGWEWKKLGEVCDTTRNFDWKKYSSEKKYIDLTSVSRKTFDITDYKIINKNNAPSRAKKIVLTNDVIFGTTRPTLKRVAIIKNDYNEAICSTGFVVLRGKSNRILSEWIFHQLTSSPFMRYVETIQKGASYPAVTDTEVKQYLIPLPPLFEQKRIVAILDKAFAAIDKAKANAEKNLANAKELFESYLNEIFNSALDTNESWEEKYLDELGEITSSKRIYKSEYVKRGIPFYRTKEIKEISNGREISLELFISKKRYNEIKQIFGVPQKGDLLLSAVGTIGEILVIEDDNEFYFKDGNIIWLKNFDSLDTIYLKYALTAFVEKLKSLAIGSAYNALTIEKLSKYKILFPRDIEEQNRIVAELDALKAETKQLESIYQQKITALDELKKSILKKAFEGEL